MPTVPANAVQNTAALKAVVYMPPVQFQAGAMALRVHVIDPTNAEDLEGAVIEVAGADFTGTSTDEADNALNGIGFERVSPWLFDRDGADANVRAVTR